MRILVILTFLIVAITAAPAQAVPVWKIYQNAEFGFSIELPYGDFAPQPGGPRPNGITLSEVGGAAEISVYGGVNAKGTDPAKLAALLGGADQVRAVTYRAGGPNWIVLSGYYAGGASKGGARVIFYTKLMFSRDHGRISAFEISYPEADKVRFDPIVAGLERSLRPPR